MDKKIAILMLTDEADGKKGGVPPLSMSGPD